VAAAEAAAVAVVAAAGALDFAVAVPLDYLLQYTTKRCKIEHMDDGLYCIVDIVCCQLFF
jgi:hypothetical protein